MHYFLHIKSNQTLHGFLLRARMGLQGVELLREFFVINLSEVLRIRLIMRKQGVGM
jgi:hypothetical protein